MARSLPPEVRQRGGGSVFRRANPELLADALPQLLVHCGDAGLAVELDEPVALGHDFEFALDHGLVADERPVQIVRKGHVAASFPVADGLSFLELAAESS